MLSLIICSRKHDISEQLKNNIASTVGLVWVCSDVKCCWPNVSKYGQSMCGGSSLYSMGYELIVIDNSHNEYNIFSAYNEGVRRSSGDILCFMHEDILYHTNNWGKIVIEHFERDLTTGMIGVVGTHFMARFSSPWWASSMRSGQIIQGSYIDGKYSSKEEKWYGRKCSDSIEAVVVDGLWMCIRRSLFEDGLIRFDDIVFSGFHCYDSDICMQVISSGYEVRVVFDILIEHMSVGCADLNYYSTLDLWYNKWKNVLPVFRGVKMSQLDVEERNNICSLFSAMSRNILEYECHFNQTLNTKAYKIGQLISRIHKKIKFFNFLQLYNRNKA